MKKNKHFTNNLRQIRKALGLTAKEFAVLRGEGESTIFVAETNEVKESRAYEFSKTINKILKQDICLPSDLTDPNFSIAEFLSRTQNSQSKPIFQPQNLDRIKTEDLAKHGEYFPDKESNTLSIPFIEAKACCGNGIMDFDHAIKFKLALSLIDNILNTKVLPEDVKSNRYFFISAEGDSMQPFIESGDALMIDTNIKIIPQHRQILLVEDAGNRKMLREFCYLTGNKYRVRAYNKEYESYDKVSYEYIVNEIFGGSFTILGGLVPISIGRFKYPDVEALSRNVIVPK
jgi:hypothetical protein